MSNSIVLLLALAGLAVPLLVLAGVSLFAVSHCPGVEGVPLRMCATVTRAAIRAVFVGVLAMLAPTVRDCCVGLENASRVRPHQHAIHTQQV